MRRALFFSLLCLVSDTGAAQSQPTQLPPLAMELIEELVAALKPTLPPDSAVDADVLRNGILRIAKENFATLSQDSSLSRKFIVTRYASDVALKIVEAARVKRNGQKAKEWQATEEILRLVSLAYLLVGMGDPPYRPYMIAVKSLSWVVATVGVVIVIWAPSFLSAEENFWVHESLVGATGIAFFAIVLTPTNWGRIHIPPEISRLYPKNSTGLTLIRNAVNARFWKIVARYLHREAESNPDGREFLNDWLPGYRHRLWFMTARDLRNQNTSPAQRFFETLKSKFPPPDQSDCSELLDKPAS
jgi:hypothetical protein